MKYYTSKLITIVLILQFIATFALGDDTGVKTPFGYTISYETTRYTGPIAEDGGLDFFAALNDEISEGVTPDNNLAIDITKILGADEFLYEKTRRRIVDQLGIRQLPEHQRFCSIEEFYQRTPIKHITIPAPEGKTPYRLPNEFIEKPWSATEHPDVATWLALNKAALDKLVLATKTKDRFYIPILPVDNHELFTSTTLPKLGEIGNLSKVFCARAMLNYQKGNTASAIADSLTLLLMGQSMCGSGMIMNELVGYQTQRYGTDVLQYIIADSQLSVTELVHLQKSLNSLREIEHISASVNRERIDLLAAAAYLAKASNPGLTLGLNYIDDTDDFDALAERATSFPSSKIDWDVPMRMINKEYNWKIEILKSSPKSYSQLQEVSNKRKEAHMEHLLAHFQNADDQGSDFHDFMESDEAIQQILRKWVELLQDDDPAARQLRSEIAGEYLIVLMVPTLAPAGSIYNAQQAKRRLTKLAIALAIYKARNKSWPASLDQLQDVNIPQSALIDPCSNKQFIYKPHANGSGYLLYSVGKNCKDDGGLDDTFDGDIVISVGCDSEVESLGK